MSEFPDCPHCRYPLSFVGGGRFECDHCGEEYDRWDLEEEAFVDEDIRTFTCPNGCGEVKFRHSHRMWHCTECGLPFFESELEQAAPTYFGLCKHCGEWALIEPDGQDYYCTNCATTDELGSVMYRKLSEAPKWEGEITGCYACGAAAHGAAKVGQPTQCLECGCTYTPIEKMNRSCPDCKKANASQLNTVHVGVNVQEKQDIFFCLDCLKSFVVGWEKCDCGHLDCRISTTSTFGWMFTCPSCGKDFLEAQTENSTARTRIIFGNHDDDDDWGWGYNRVVNIEDSLKRKYLLECEI